jgi:hypothetical protein
MLALWPLPRNKKRVHFIENHGYQNKVGSATAGLVMKLTVPRPPLRHLPEGDKNIVFVAKPPARSGGASALFLANGADSAGGFRNTWLEMRFGGIDAISKM